MDDLTDMHCHLGLMTNGDEVAAAAFACDTLIFNNTVSPADWQAERRAFAPFPNVTTGFGMHPWWVTDGAADEGKCLELLETWEPQVIGEVGLDLGDRHQATAADQQCAFAAIVRWAGRIGGRLLSLHAVHAAAEVLDVLEDSGAAESCRCIFHWFSGPSDQLKRAIADGCFFSCGPRMLRTGKGREYVKAIPAERLLLETDLPAEQGACCTFEELRGQLQSAAEAIAAIKGAEALPVIADTSEALLALHSPLAERFAGGFESFR